MPEAGTFIAQYVGGGGGLFMCVHVRICVYVLVCACVCVTTSFSNSEKCFSKQLKIFSNNLFCFYVDWKIYRC